MGVSVAPEQKVEFQIHIFKFGNTIKLLNRAGKLLYTQTSKFGNFQFSPKDRQVFISIYGEYKGHQITSYQRKNNGDTAIFYIGNNVEIKVKTSLTKDAIDTIDKHFVRFLCFSSLMFPRINFSVSTKKLPPPNPQTEPLFEEFLTSEDNFIESPSVYQTFAEFVKSNCSTFSNNPNIIKSSIFVLEINVDFKNRYYLNTQQTILFLTKFVTYLQKTKTNILYKNRLNTMLFYAKSAQKSNNSLPPDPN